MYGDIKDLLYSNNNNDNIFFFLSSCVHYIILQTLVFSSTSILNHRRDPSILLMAQHPRCVEKMAHTDALSTPMLLATHSLLLTTLLSFFPSHTHVHLILSSVSPAVLQAACCHSPPNTEQHSLSLPGPAALSAGAFIPACQREWEWRRRGGNGTGVTSSHSVADKSIHDQCARLSLEPALKPHVYAAHALLCRICWYLFIKSDAGGLFSLKTKHKFYADKSRRSCSWGNVNMFSHHI